MWTRLWRWLRRPATDSLGARGEVAAAHFLRRKGYRIVARQLRSEFGELDLVALDRRVVVFVEVKTRRSLSAGHPAEAIDIPKQRRLTRAALAFLRQHHLLEQSARFDVVAVLWPPDAHRPVIEHRINAFEPPGKGQFYA